jgi:hypothetical protein
MKTIAVSMNRHIKVFIKLGMKVMPQEVALKLRILISSHKCYQQLQSKDANCYVFCRVSVLITSAYVDNV